MITKYSFNTKEDFTGEMRVTPKTKAYYKLNQLPQDLENETKQIANEIEIVYSNGNTLGVRDGWLQQYRTTYHNMQNINTGGLNSIDGIVSMEEATDLLDHPVNVPNLEEGSLITTYNVASDGGTNRAFYVLFKPTEEDLTTPYGKAILTQRISSNNGYHIGILDGKAYTRAYDSSGNLVFNTYIGEALTAGLWYQVIVTHSNTSIKTYLNGIYQGTETLAQAGSTIDYVRPLKFGRMLGYATNKFKGLISAWGFHSEYISGTQAKTFFNTFRQSLRFSPENVSLSRSTGWTESYSNTFYNMHYAKYSNVANSTFDITFVGTKIKLYGRVYASGGDGEIYIDGNYIETASYYGVGDASQLVTTIDNLIKTQHTLQIKVVGNGNVSIDYFEIFNKNFQVASEGSNNFLHPDIDTTHYAKKQSIPYILPRFELDGLDERALLFVRNLNGEDSDLTLAAGATFSKTDKVVDNEITVLENSGGYAYTSNTPSSDGGTSRSFITWFKPTSSDLDGSYHIMASQRVSTNIGYHCGVNPSSRFYVRAYDSSQTLLLEENFSTGDVLIAEKWYCIILTHDSSNYRVFLNNTLWATGTYTGTIDYTTNYFKFGTYGSGNGSRFNGQIGSVFLWSLYLTQTNVNSYLNNVVSLEELLPQHAKVELTGDWEWVQTSSTAKELVSSTIGDSYKITFQGIQAKFQGTSDTDGAKATLVFNDIDQTDIDEYATSNSYGEICNLSSAEYQENIVIITNKDGRKLRIGEIIFNAGNNIILDYSEYKNNAEMINYSADGRTDIIQNGKIEYGLKFVNTGSNKMHLLLPREIFTDIGDVILFSWWMKPAPLTGSLVTNYIFDNFNTPEGNNPLVAIRYYQNPPMNYDSIRVTSNFIDVNVITASKHLTAGEWYQCYIIIDQVNRQVKWTLYEPHTSSILLNVVFPFITGQNVNTLNLNQFRVGTNGNNNTWSTIIMDEIVIEPNSDFDTSVNFFSSYYYYRGWTNGGLLDDSNNVSATYYSDGRITLKKESANSYISEGVYTSGRMYMGTKWNETGKINLSAILPENTSITDIETRTSNDGYSASGVWSSWEAVSDIGIIASPNRTYIQVRFTLHASPDKLSTPEVTSIDVLGVAFAPYTRKAFALPVIYNENGDKEAVLHDSFNILETIELNGAMYLTFDIPFLSTKNSYIDSEKKIRLDDTTYIIRTIKDKNSGNKPITSVYCEALFYDLAFMPPIKEKDFLLKKPQEIINYILKGTGWELLECDIYISRDFNISNNANVLEELRNVQTLFGGDLIFNNETNTISYLNNSGTDTGYIFSYRKNSSNLIRTIDSSKVCNRLYMYGKDDLSFSSINNNKEYIDVNPEIETKKSLTLTNTYFGEAENLKDFAIMKATEYKAPTRKYELELKDLSVLDVSNETNYNVGDIITIHDELFNITEKARIISIVYNIKMPNKSKFTISNKIRELGDDISEFEKSKRKIAKIDFKLLRSMITGYLFTYLRGIGYISSEYIQIQGTAKVGSVGIVNMPSANDRLYVRTTPSLSGSIITSKNHLDSITVLAIIGDFYKINF